MSVSLDRLSRSLLFSEQAFMAVRAPAGPASFTPTLHSAFLEKYGGVAFGIEGAQPWEMRLLACKTCHVQVALREHMKAQKYTLLIVDDDEDQRFLAQQTFEGLATRYKVQLAANGAEAIAYLQGKGKFADRKKFEFPSYILTDLQMKPGDGFHVLEFIKNNPALSIIPVVMLSSSDDADDIRQAYLLGASSFFVKPATLSQLKALLRKIHDYWTECEVPEVDTEGYAVGTKDTGRLGARYKKPKR